VTLLEQHPQSQTVHHLLALEVRLRMKPAQKGELLGAATKKYEAGSVEDLAVFAAWLNQQREFSHTIRALPLQLALTQRDLLMIYLDAVAGMERWREVQQILARPELPMPDAYLEAFRARTAAKINDPAAASAAWRRALQAATGHADDLAFLAQYAERNGEFDQAKRAYRALAMAQSDQLPVYMAWLRMLQQVGTTEELRDLLKEMSDRWPNELAFKNDLAYLDLLLKRNIEPALRTAEQLVSAFPQNLPLRATLSLARLRSGQPASALAAFDGRAWDWNQALPSNRAVYAAALAAEGKITEARELVRTLPTESLRKEERELIGGFVAWK
jgi:hypothetical protein